MAPGGDAEAKARRLLLKSGRY
ncbi:hypothetical protein E2C01_092775 [Portunus trituberculatus]|uniref:Uncharacterized protein n=1 Tax=Portunus trituberculatus TaxID=210409 RepID=A0A5B7JWT0_PORTR|nr:hypothetical protein [Portunus trituberculatus]